MTLGNQVRSPKGITLGYTNRNLSPMKCKAWKEPGKNDPQQKGLLTSLNNRTVDYNQVSY